MLQLQQSSTSLQGSLFLQAVFLEIRKLTFFAKNIRDLIPPFLECINDPKLVIFKISILNFTQKSFFDQSNAKLTFIIPYSWINKILLNYNTTCTSKNSYLSEHNSSLQEQNGVLIQRRDILICFYYHCNQGKNCQSISHANESIIYTYMHVYVYF